MSDHSFGWAIDIDAKLNPNVKLASFPNPLVEKFTGVDVYGGEAVTSIRAGGKAEELLPKVRILTGASALFKKTFESEDSLLNSISVYLKDQGLKITAGLPPSLPVRAAINSAGRFTKPYAAMLDGVPVTLGAICLPFTVFVSRNTL